MHEIHAIGCLFLGQCMLRIGKDSIAGPREAVTLSIPRTNSGDGSLERRDSFTPLFEKRQFLSTAGCEREAAKTVSMNKPTTVQRGQEKPQNQPHPPQPRMKHKRFSKLSLCQANGHEPSPTPTCKQRRKM